MSDTDKQSQWRVGDRNLITDVPGLRVGNAGDHHIKSGVTVLTADNAFVASVDVMGGAPGTRETDCLAPDKLVEQVDALVLSGGSAFGLDAVSGVMDALRKSQRGFPVGPVQVPIVPAAIIFDLLNGGESNWTTNPYPVLGKRAFDDAAFDFALGTQGAGMGATTANLKGGLGSASLMMPDGVVIGALVVANPHGSVVVSDGPRFWAAPFEMNGEFGALGVGTSHDVLSLPRNAKLEAYEAMHGSPGSITTSSAHMNTTIAIVATNATMSKAQLKRLAVAAQDGIARAVVPAHTPFDGDLIFSVSTRERELEDPLMDSLFLGHAAATCLSRAIARAIYHAVATPHDTLPTWSSLTQTDG